MVKANPAKAMVALEEMTMVETGLEVVKATDLEANPEELELESP
jgi:hypothetical protein